MIETGAGIGPDPHLFIANPDQALQFNADPIPYQGDANLRPLVYRPSRPLFQAFTFRLCGRPRLYF